MDAIKIYSDMIKNRIDKPEKFRKMLKMGYNLEYLRLKLVGEKDLPKSLNYLSELCMKFTLDPLKEAEKTAFINVFTPGEFLHAFDLHPQLIEAFSSYISGTRCEDALIDVAESNGIADSLCSYHKTFIGGAISKVLEKPRFAITTSTACDGNINTFKLVASLYNIDTFVIDVPYDYSERGVDYVEEQLHDMVKFMEEHLGEKLNHEKLKKIVQRENESLRCYKEYLKLLGEKYFPNSLTIEMFKVFVTHPFIGREDTLKFYQMLLEDIKKYPYKEPKKKILWAHLLPFYSQSLRAYLDKNEDYQLLMSDMNADNLDYLDENDIYKSIAKKIILNTYNGPYERRGNNILKLAKELKADGVVNFCHWGCKQSSGGSLILKEILSKNDIPMLSIDGDAVDRRNSQEGQNKTRLEAFFEMLDAKDGGKK
ncbi:2-hydroxyacyl-CoA dehydratase family protein [uncultured Clostridium sp.]|uniref:2-hydroxyacyl-CoA dehydratase subunit D n=1 Tax=uncultured Clostridium sp. TaxID=59620 RepID=UPI002615FF20|nr:2-hydroxyacyl-CoA dehydratase family protein [uncultured Clostridium sp.]